MHRRSSTSQNPRISYFLSCHSLTNKQTNNPPPFTECSLPQALERLKTNIQTKLIASVMKLEQHNLTSHYAMAFQ